MFDHSLALRVFACWPLADFVSRGSNYGLGRDRKFGIHLTRRHEDTKKARKLLGISMLALLSACSSPKDTNQSSPTKATIETASIPVRFQGLWLAHPEQCGKADWQEGLNIRANAIGITPRDFEQISKVQPQPGDSIIVTATDPNAGMAFDGTGRFRFSLSADGKTLRNHFDNRTASFDYMKCDTINAPNP